MSLVKDREKALDIAKECHQDAEKIRESSSGIPVSEHHRSATIALEEAENNDNWEPMKYFLRSRITMTLAFGNKEGANKLRLLGNRL